MFMRLRIHSSGHRLVLVAMTNQQAAALRYRITVFQAELDACETEAQRRCVKQAILAAERQLTEGL